MFTLVISGKGIYQFNEDCIEKAKKQAVELLNIEEAAITDWWESPLRPYCGL